MQHILKELESFRVHLQDYFDDNNALERDYNKLCDVVELFSEFGLVEAISLAGYNLAVELGEPIPALWRLSSNRSLETIREIEERAKTECHKLQAAIS